jgi:hypothetical protein
VAEESGVLHKPEEMQRLNNILKSLPTTEGEDLELLKGMRRYLIPE